MPDEKSFHMTPDEFRRHGHAVVDWIADYHSRIESFPVLSQVKPGEIRASLPANPPAQGEPFEALLKDVEKLILPGITHWQSPNFFAYFPSNGSGPGILGDLLSSGLGVQGMLWSTSPACTELETHVLDWLVPMLGLPEKFLSSSTGGGVIQDTASSAVLCALLAARERATNYASNQKGCDGRVVAYASTQTHSAIQKAAMIAGIGVSNLRVIEVDENFAMRPDALARQIEADKHAGLVPCLVCATVGTTSSNAMDPIPEIAQICGKHNLWLHVDAAMSGTAALCPEFRHLQNGVELADSYNFNPHKWMFTTFDCDCFWVADRKALIRTLSILPEFLRNQATESGAVIDYRDWHIQLGRRFRSLKLWFVIRHYGVEGLQHHIRRHVQLAQQFAEWVRNDARFELAAPVPLNLVCFRHKSGDAANQTIMERLNRSGDLFLTHTKLNGKFTLRLLRGTDQHGGAARGAGLEADSRRSGEGNGRGVTRKRSLRGLRSLGKEVGLALFGGGEQLVELRRAFQLREPGISLHRGVGAIVACDGAPEQPLGDIVLPTEGISGCEQIPVLGVRIGQRFRRKLPGEVVHLGGWRVVDTSPDQRTAEVIGQVRRRFPSLLQVPRTNEMAHEVARHPNGSSIELEKIHRPGVVTHFVEGERTRAESIVPRIQ